MTSILRHGAALLFLLLAFGRLEAQEAKYRVDVNADLDAAPDDGRGTVKMVKGDATMVVALKTKDAQGVFGGVNQKDLAWTLTTYTAETMKLAKTDAPKIVYGLTQVNLETIEYFGGRLRLLATQPDPETGKLRFIEQVLDARSLTGKGAREFHLMPFDRLGKSPEYYLPYAAVGFNSVVSQDSSMLMLHLTPDFTVRPAGCPIYTMVFNKDMTLKWENTLQTAGNLEALQVLGTRLDKNGAAWYLMKNITKMEPTDPKMVGYEIVLYRMDSTGQQQVKLDLPGADYPTDARFELLPDGRVMVGGVYSSEDNNRDQSIGLFMTKLDPATLSDPKGGQWGAFKQNELSKVEDKKKGLILQKSVVMVRMMPRKDGGADLVTENNWLENYTSSTLGGTAVQKTRWEHGNVHVMRFSGAGEPVFYTEIERHLIFERNAPGRIIAASYQDALYLFMNDNEVFFQRRKDKTPLERVAVLNDAVMFEFKADGTYKNKVFMKDTYKQGVFAPDHVWYVSSSWITVPGTATFAGEKTFPICIQFSSGARR